MLFPQSSHRAYSPTDRLLINADHALRTLFGRSPTTERRNPAAALKESEIGDDQRRLVGRLGHHRGPRARLALGRAHQTPHGFDQGWRERQERCARRRTR